MSNEINRFTGDYSFLSNFARCKVYLDGVEYPTVEHAFQAAKSTDMLVRKVIRSCPTPGRAKQMGRKVVLRPNWDSIKISVMSGLLLTKFSPNNPHMLSALLATGDAQLIEGNDWGDTFWGVCQGKGDNWLGKLLMEVRKAR